MIQYIKSSATPPSSLRLVLGDSPIYLFEEEIMHNSIQQGEQEGHDNRGADNVADSTLLPISAKRKLNPLQDIFRTIPSTRIRHIDPNHANYDMPRENIVSYASDSDDCETSDTHDQDPTTPLDYRRDWSLETQNTLHVVLGVNTLFQSVDDDDLDDIIDCKSIASIDIDSDYEDEVNSPISEWIHNENIIW